MIITLKGATFTHKLNLNVWLVNSSLVGVDSSNTASSVTKGGSYTTTFTIRQGFKIDSDSTVSVVCNGQTYPLSWSSTEAGGTASLKIDEVTAPITITVKASTVSGTVVNPDTGDDNEDTDEYPFDTANMLKFDLSTAEWEQGTVGNTGANGSSATRIRTKTPYSVPYDNVTFYVKVDSPYVGGIRSGTSATSTPLNQYWFSNDAEYGGGIKSTIPSPNIGWEITIPTGHTMFWPVLAVGDGTQTNNTTNILPADASSTGFELWYLDKTKLTFSVNNYVDNVQVANCVESVGFGETVTATYTANSGFTLPDSIEVQGGTLSNWDKSTGVATITNVSDTLNITVSANRSDIPTDYTPISYIRMKASNLDAETITGLSTGVIASNTTGGEYCFKQNNANTTNIKTNGVYETSIADTAKRRWYMPYFESNVIGVGWNDLKKGQTVSDATQLHVASTNKENCRKAYIDGELINLSVAELESLTLESSPIGIGVLCDNGAIVAMASTAVDCQYYWIKLWQNTELVRDMVPVLRKSDNEPGFYDFVESKFYTNEGVVPFTYA